MNKIKWSTGIKTALIALLIGCLAVLSTSSAQAAVRCTERVGGTLPGGPGHPDTVYAGTWTCGDVIGFCGNFTLHNPDGAAGSRVIHRMPHMSALKSAEFAIINHQYRLTKDKSLAMQAAYAEWKLQGIPAFRQYNSWATKNGLFPGVRSGANDMIARAHLLVGLKLHVNLKSSYVGQTKNDYVLNTGTGGKPVSGIRNQLSVNANGKLSRTSGTSNSRGKVGFDLTKTDLGTVTVHAKAEKVNVNYIVSTSPTVGFQHIYAVPNVKTITAQASFNQKLNRPTVKSVCDTNCDGNAKVSVHFCNPKDAATYGYFGHDQNGKLVLTMNIAGGACKTKNVTLHDADVLHSSYCLKKAGKCFTKMVDIKQTYKVKCPPAPTVYFSAKCDCNGVQSFTSLVQVPSSKRVYKDVVTDNGTQLGSVHTLTVGGDTTIDLSQAHSGDTIVEKITAYDKSTGKALRTWSFTETVPVVNAA